MGKTRLTFCAGAIIGCVFMLCTSCGAASPKPYSANQPNLDPAAFARYTYNVIRANDQARFAGDVLMTPVLCASLAGQLAPSRPVDRVCREYERNSGHSFQDISSMAAGPLNVIGMWNKRYGSVSAVMVETTFITRTGQEQAMKVELMELNGRLYLFSLHLTALSCRGKSSCS